jgi:hypothetical protein
MPWALEGLVKIREIRKVGANLIGKSNNATFGLDDAIWTSIPADKVAASSRAHEDK